MGRQLETIIDSLGTVTLGTLNASIDLTPVTADTGAIETDTASMEANLASLTTDIANGVTINQPVAVTDNNGSLTVDGTVTADSNRGNLTAASTQSITTGGTHQQVFASNASRKFLLVQNLSDTDMYLGIGFNPSNTTPDGILLSKSGGGIVFESSYIPTQEIRIVCATTGKRFEALEA